jgi:CheY-like chemotaxis protein
MLDVQSPTETHASSEGRILVVDDDALARFILADQLGALGCRCVDTAFGGIDALNRALDRPYDLVITDLCMPDMSGQRLLAALRANGLDMPVIAGTAWGDPASARSNGSDGGWTNTGLPDGFAAVLRKPFSMTQLQRLLRAYLRGKPRSADGAGPAIRRRRALQVALAAAWPEDETALRAALASRDTRALQDRLHRLHGALAVAGEARVRRACMRLQQRVFQEGIDPNVERIERFMQLCAAMGDHSSRG